MVAMGGCGHQAAVGVVLDVADGDGMLTRLLAAVAEAAAIDGADTKPLVAGDNGTAIPTWAAP
jgi:hypothetical protein